MFAMEIELGIYRAMAVDGIGLYNSRVRLEGNLGYGV